MDSTQVCTKCGIEKPLSDFYFRKRRGAHEKRCRACATKWHREYMPEYRAGVRRKCITPIEERLWRHVDKNGPEVIPGSPCWIWTASVDFNGYGMLPIRGRHGGAHRISWELANGEKLGERPLMHLCDVPRCVRPDHLRPCTQRENIHDMIAKGRHCHGFRSERAVFKTIEEVEQVRSMHRAGWSACALGRHFGCSDTTIRRVLSGWPDRSRSQLTSLRQSSQATQ